LLWQTAMGRVQASAGMTEEDSDMKWMLVRGCH